MSGTLSPAKFEQELRGLSGTDKWVAIRWIIMQFYNMLYDLWVARPNPLDTPE